MDNDGDQDVYVQMGGQLPGDQFHDALFENPGFGHRWISLQLQGKTSNRAAIGARIHVKIIEEGKPRSIHRVVGSGGSFGCNPLRQNIGLGKAEKLESIEIFWPTSKLKQQFVNVTMDRTFLIEEGKSTLDALSLKTFKLGGE